MKEVDQPLSGRKGKERKWRRMEVVNLNCQASCKHLFEENDVKVLFTYYEVECSHKIDYYCDCKIHTGFLHLFEIAEYNHKAVCSGGHDRLISTGMYTHADFMTVPVMALLNK